MRKIIAMFFILLFLSGCSYEKIKTNDYEYTLEKFLGNDTKLVNTYSVGYKYYLPSGVRVIDSSNYNEKLASNNTIYYLYVDAVSYYFKNEVEFIENKDIFLSKKLNYNDKTGYINIEKSDDLYKVVFYYNYGKIEAYVDENNLVDELINMCYILNSLVFNDSVVESDIGVERTELKEETYDFYKPKSKDNFIDYITLYDEYEDLDESDIGNQDNDS